MLHLVLTGAWVIAGILNAVLAVAIVARSWPAAALFAVAAVALVAGSLLGWPWLVVLGALAALAGPLVVGLTGVEPLALVHHLVRGGVLAAMLVAWLWTRIPTAPLS